MIANKLSIIIPSYRDVYLSNTIDSVLRSSKDDIEIIVFLDEYDKLQPLNNDRRVKYIKSYLNMGMRYAINESVKASSGEFIMKLDSHCDIMEGFDVMLKNQTGKNMVSVPSRYSLNVDDWSRFNGPIDYLYLKYPNEKDKDYVFRMRLFKEKIKKENNPMIDDIIAFQGSCWFMHKTLFKRIGHLDNKLFDSFGSEAHEISMKVLLTLDGCRVVRNRNVWYAHYRPDKLWKCKPKKLRNTMISSMKTAFKLDILNKWPNQKRSFKSIVDKFGPFPGWPKNWHSIDNINILKSKGHV